ncbi:E3 ubiquitin-protein ligase UHRF1 [Psilocybe cubensis]|uniref:E3 ubiquitin-protein ligase UHRF1 n=2 Tax=Psilocybe cubensis TaxID=181762 RepID=A0ACB8HG38_PSICU|nr:E3 ubiquitin-protein ligase UHRF1 [Psilocybe cubensis]KAH9486906.1 E3 ubiquitin-protein ligase UHRF1 [Psilocybe cubensis]
MPSISSYEQLRLENIKKNRELLMQLGLDKPIFEPTEKVVKKPTATKKRKGPDTPTSENAEPDTKAQRVSPSQSTPESGVRRSSRNVGKTVNYKREIVKESPIPVAYSSGVKVAENEGPMGREDGPRRCDPKTYGSIPGIAVGTWWPTRQGCSADAIHAPWVGGISGGKQGAYSVALSGGYDDDVDLGYAFTYTGSGGRDLKGTKTAPKNLRTAPQSSDQSFENNASFNKMLQRSCETKKPVRVVRGFKCKSEYAPSEGYRYDGLYRVERAWMEKGMNAKGYLVCKFAFKRLPNQPPLPVRASLDSMGNSARETLEEDEENPEEVEDEPKEE